MAKRILKKYCTKSYRKLKHRKGFGVHSPFAFNIITKVIEEKAGYYAYQKVDELRHTFIRGKLNDADKALRKPISRKTGTLLFRLVNRFKPETILECNTSWGISTLFLHYGNTSANYFCIETEKRIQDFSSGITQGLFPDIRYMTGNITEIVPGLFKEGHIPDFIYLNRFRDAESYRSVLKLLEPCFYKNTVIVIEGIHTDKEITGIWQELISDEKVRVSMDLYDLGILFCEPRLNKQDYIVAF